MNNPSFPLTALRLRFECEALDPIQLGGLKAGSNLRGALVNVMRRATCAAHPNATLGAAPGLDPEHAKTCPVCWLVAASERPGEERRGYTLTPPLGQDRLNPAERFAFHLTLFGNAVPSLPYFVLSVPEAGRVGVGAGRGRFALKNIWAEYPGREAQQVLKEGENIVRPPHGLIDHPLLLNEAESRLGQGFSSLQVEWMTPLRLIVGEKLLKAPDFGALFAALLKRLDDLSIQFSGGQERPAAERQALWAQANRVRLVDNRAQWVEVQSGSSRTGQKTWLSGLLGSARYSAPPETWRTLWPWLAWGELTQVGKDTVKGNGVYRVRVNAKC